MSHDSSLQHAVLAELSWDPKVNSSGIGVTAKDGVVALNGQAESYGEKLAAEAAARRVKGVKALVAEIEVHAPHAQHRCDEDIARAALARLAWNAAVPPGSVSVQVAKGGITLTGEVDHRFQFEAAEREVGQLYGVVAVTNRITVKPEVNTTDISAAISEALDRSWLFDPETVTVKADGGTVHLGGTVRTMQQRRRAVGAAWSSEGTTAVDDQITIV
jgi:osmotically-inducible protein OsmY